LTSRLKRSFLLTLLLATSTTVLHAKSAKKAKGPIISRITIRATDVFDTDTKTYLKKFPYTWINALHIQTHQEVIERELLFKVGDPVDPFLVKETERNLRALSFIQAARIAQFPQRDGSVALLVYVSDSWTTEPQINLGGQNKVNQVEFGFKEKNLFGFGKTVQYLHSKSPGKTEQTYKYSDPRLLGSRWQLDAQAVTKTTGDSRGVSVVRPFYAADARWSARAAHNKSREVVGDFENNVRVSEVEQSGESNEMGMSFKVGEGRDVVNHAGLRYRKEDTRFAATDKTTAGRALPGEQKFQTLFLDLDTSYSRFIDLQRIEKMTRVEDFNLGPSFQLSPGFSPHALTGREDSEQLGANYDQKWLVNDLHLLMAEFHYTGREFLTKPKNTRYSVGFRGYQRGFRHQTLVGHTRIDWGQSLDPNNQIILGADNGMRAYKSDQFTGVKSAVLNLEDRVFLLDDFLNLISEGGAELVRRHVDEF
jgi:hypothetical protein